VSFENQRAGSISFGWLAGSAQKLLVARGQRLHGQPERLFATRAGLNHKDRSVHAASTTTVRSISLNGLRAHRAVVVFRSRRRVSIPNWSAERLFATRAGLNHSTLSVPCAPTADTVGDVSLCCRALANCSHVGRVTDWPTPASKNTRCSVTSAVHRNSGCRLAAARPKPRGMHWRTYLRLLARQQTRPHWDI
jgi:hypothetical protein